MDIRDQLPRWNDDMGFIFGSILTSDSMDRHIDALIRGIGGRLSGTPDGRAAEVWAETAMLEAGAEEVESEPFSVVAWTRGPAEVRFGGGMTRSVPALALGLSRGTPEEGIDGAVIDMGYGQPDRIRDRKGDIRGRWILVKDGGPKGGKAFHRSVKMEIAQEVGALGLLLVADRPGALPRTGTCQTGILSKIPAVGLSHEDGRALRRLLAGGTGVTCRIHMRNEAVQGEARNLFGILPGDSAPQERILVGGHLDAWDIAEGAMDNGSGVLVAMEALRALAALGRPLKRTVACGLFMGEETGLLGSRHHVNRAGVKLDDTVAYLNLDIVSDPIRLVAGGNPAHFPLLDRIVPALKNLGVAPEVREEVSLHSDHVNLLLAGVPTLSWQCRFEEETTMFCHSAADTVDKIELKGLRLCACATAALIYALAEVPERPAHRISGEIIKALMEEAGLKDELVAEHGWPF